MESTMLINSKLRCPEENLPTDIWIMTICYALFVYIWIPCMQSGIYDIIICSRKMFDPVSETLSNFHD